MTINRKQKKAVRARAADNDVSYLEARRREPGSGGGSGGGGGSAQVLWRQAADLFARRGWPVVVEETPQFGQWVFYPGPMRIAVTDPALDPDDLNPEPGDPTVTARSPMAPGSPAGEVFLSAPFLGPTPDAVAEDLDPGASAEDLLAAAGAAMSRGRVAALRAGTAVAGIPGAGTPGARSLRAGSGPGGALRAGAPGGAGAASECVICGERFPTTHLLEPTPEPALRACPSCVFDGDMTLYYADPPWLAYQLDELLDTDLGAPSAWAAVAAVLAHDAHPDLAGHLERDWRAAGTSRMPGERWQDVNNNWIWLPAPEHRPAWQAQLGPGARPQALVTAVDAAHPELRDAFIEELHAHYLDEDDQPRPEPDVLAGGWQTAVTYAAALHTDTVDHPERRDPWHALDSFDALAEHLDDLDADTDDLLLTAMIHAGVSALHHHGAIPRPGG